MSAEAQAIPLNVEPSQSQARKSRSRTVLETMEHLSSVGGLADGIGHLEKATHVVESGIKTGATKTGGWLSKLGLKKLATLCVKIAAASPVIAKVVVALAVVAVAVGIYFAVRG